VKILFMYPLNSVEEVSEPLSCSPKEDFSGRRLGQNTSPQLPAERLQCEDRQKKGLSPLPQEGTAGWVVEPCFTKGQLQRIRARNTVWDTQAVP